MSVVFDLLKQGLAHDRAGRHDESAKLYRRVLELEPGQVDALHLLGLALLDLGDTTSARDYVERAVQARPYNAIFCRNYATIVSNLGAHELAASHFRRAISLKPDYAEAYHGLAGVIKATREDRLLDDIEQLLAHSEHGPEQRAYLHFAAGKLADDIGEPDRAFPHFASGNRAAARSFDRAAHEAATTRQLRVFDRALFDRLQGVGSDSEEMIFIVGMPRSGTTLVEQIVSSHPMAQAAGERRDIPVIARILPQQDPQGRRFPDCVPHIGVEAFGAFADRYLSILGRLNGTARRFTDKNPLNFIYLGLIALMFPRARIVHCRRDPVDTCLSCYFQYFQRDLDFTFDLSDLAAVYGDYRRLMNHWREHLPIPMLDVSYEALVADPAAESRRIVEFCGLPWDEACLDYRANATPVSTASKWQVRQPIYTSSVARAQKYEAHLGPLLEGLAPYL